MNPEQVRAMRAAAQTAEPPAPAGSNAAAERLEQDLISQAAQLMQSVAEYLQATSPQDLARDTRELLRRQPALALGGAFALGVLAMRRLQSPRREQPAEPSLPISAGSAAFATERAPTRGPEATHERAAGIQGIDVPAPSRTAAPGVHVRGQSEAIGVGSPIGDAPYAGGSSR